MAAADGALKELVRTVRSSSDRTSGEIRSYSEQNNSTVQRALKDLHRVLQSNNRQTSNLSGLFSENASSTEQVSRKVDGTNSLLQQTLSIQSSLLSEMRTVGHSIKNLYDLVRSQNSGSLLGNAAGAAAGAVSSLASGFKAVAPIMIGAGAGYLGSQALNNNQSAVPANTVAPGGENNRQGAVPANGEGQGQTQELTESIMKTIRQRESSNKYDAQSKSSSASGAYQFIDKTWQGLTKQFGVGQEYTRAVFAPPAVQDQVARLYVQDILRRNNNKIEAVPKEWYAGPKGYLTERELAVNRGLTVEKYIDMWMGSHNRVNRGGNQNTAPRQPQQQNQPQQQRIPEAGETSPAPSAQRQQQAPVRTASLGPTPIPRSEENYERRQGGGQVIEDQMKEAEVRKQPISSQLKSVLSRAAEAAGVDVRVKSGGQPSAEEGGKRVGSTRHDKGNAADLDLYVGNKKLSPNNAEDLAAFKKFVSTAKAAGATGIGAGEGYMAPDASRIHVGFGSEAIWGAGGKGANAADWLREAVGQGGQGGTETAGSRRTAELQPKQGSTRADTVNRNAATVPGSGETSEGAPMGAGPQIPQYPIQTAQAGNPLLEAAALNSGLTPPWVWMLRNAFPSIGGRIQV
jgi:hypothetical protein